MINHVELAIRPDVGSTEPHFLAVTLQLSPNTGDSAIKEALNRIIATVPSQLNSHSDFLAAVSRLASKFQPILDEGGQPISQFEVTGNPQAYAEESTNLWEQLSPMFSRFNSGEKDEMATLLVHDLLISLQSPQARRVSTANGTVVKTAFNKETNPVIEGTLELIRRSIQDAYYSDPDHSPVDKALLIFGITGAVGGGLVLARCVPYQPTISQEAPAASPTETQVLLLTTPPSSSSLDTPILHEIEVKSNQKEFQTVAGLWKGEVFDATKIAVDRRFSIIDHHVQLPGMEAYYAQTEFPLTIMGEIIIPDTSFTRTIFGFQVNGVRRLFMVSNTSCELEDQEGKLQIRLGLKQAGLKNGDKISPVFIGLEDTRDPLDPDTFFTWPAECQRVLGLLGLRPPPGFISQLSDYFVNGNPGPYWTRDLVDGEEVTDLSYGLTIRD